MTALRSINPDGPPANPTKARTQPMAIRIPSKEEHEKTKLNEGLVINIFLALAILLAAFVFYPMARDYRDSFTHPPVLKSPIQAK